MNFVNCVDQLLTKICEVIHSLKFRVGCSDSGL